MLQGRREKDENEAVEAGVQRLQCHDDCSSVLLSGDMESINYEKHKTNYRI